MQEESSGRLSDDIFPDRHIDLPKVGESGPIIYDFCQFAIKLSININEEQDVYVRVYSFIPWFSIQSEAVIYI